MLETARPVLGPATEISALKVVDDLGVDHRDPAIVLVSNNPYALGGPLTRGGRPTLSGGQLGVIVIDRPAAGRRPPGRAWSSASLRIDGSAVVHAGIDGEAVELSPPLEFAVRPAALRVRTPRRSRAARGSASGGQWISTLRRTIEIPSARAIMAEASAPARLAPWWIAA